MEVDVQIKIKAWKRARIGIAVFCIIHFFLEIIFANTDGFLLSVIVNYLLSAWYAKSLIRKGKLINHTIFKGMFISFIVFLIRIVLGILFYLVNN